MKKTHSLYVALLLLTACQSEGTNNEKLEAEVMAVHDEVMPRMDELMDLKSQISTRLTQMDSLAKAGQAPSETLKQEGIALNQSLTEADSLMSEWMYKYNPDTLKALDENGARNYLTAEKKKIEAVKEKFNSSIERAKKYLQTNP